MFGTVHFTDNHIERITSYSFNLDHSELYFTTDSGQYGFKQRTKQYTYDIAFSSQGYVFKDNNFYKYYNEYDAWLTYSKIDFIELYTEVLNG